MTARAAFYTFVLITFLFATDTTAQTPSPTIPPAKKSVSADDLTAKDVAALEADLQKNPKDVEKRKLLVEYYSRSEDTNEQSKQSIRRHRLLLIKNSPNERFYTELGFWISPEDKEKTEFRELKDEYLRQVNLNKNNAAVRMNAVSFLESVDAETTERLLKEGQSLTPENEEFTDKLIELYAKQIVNAENRYDEGDKTITEADIDRAAAKFIAEAEKKADALEKVEFGKDGHDRLELLTRMGNTALEANDIKKARGFAETILRDFIKAEPDASNNEAIFYGNNLMGRVFLREGNIAKAKEHLNKSVTLYIGDTWEITQPELDLAGELLLKGERQAVLDYLEKSESLTTNTEVRKTFRYWQRMLKRNLFPYAKSEY